MPDNQIRLQTYLAHCGVASRRASEKIMEEGRVKVNGQVCSTPGTKISPSDFVTVDGKPVKPETEMHYVALYKPKGYVCTLSDEMDRPTAYDLLKDYFNVRLYNVGRLDMYSEGLVLFTNDGDFAAKLSHPSNGVEKEYLVETVYPIPDEVIYGFCRGVRVENVFYKCVSARKIKPNQMKVVLVEGKNREIRNVLNHFGVRIKRLLRFRVGNLTIEKLKLQSGKFCEISKDEAFGILKMAQNKKN